MKINKIKQYKDSLVFDDIDDTYYHFTVPFVVVDENIGITLSEFKSLYKLKPILGDVVFNQLINQIEGIEESKVFPDAFSGISNLPINGCIKEINEKKYIFIISTGEFQPGRYKIYLEGIWELL